MPWLNIILIKCLQMLSLLAVHCVLYSVLYTYIAILHCDIINLNDFKLTLRFVCMGKTTAKHLNNNAHTPCYLLHLHNFYYSKLTLKSLQNFVACFCFYLFSIFCFILFFAKFCNYLMKTIRHSC